MKLELLRINKMSVLAFYGLIVPAGLLSIWGMGGFMAAISRVRGWNTNLTFWVSAILYTLLLIGLYVAAVIANNAPDYSYDLTIRLLVLLVVVIMIGLLLPLGVLVLFWMYPDAFKKVMRELFMSLNIVSTGMITADPEDEVKVVESRSNNGN